MKLKPSHLFALASAGIAAAQTDVDYTPPLGAETFTVSAGTTAGPVTSPFAFTLADRPATSGRLAGAISSVDGNVITVTGAGWTDSALAHSEFPYDLVLASGNGQGARLWVTANTADTVTVSGRDLTTLGVAAGDEFRLSPVDTLASLFGSEMFQGGTSAAEADVIGIGAQGRQLYYYNTTNSQWQQTDDADGDKGGTRIPPSGMIAVVRKSDAFAFTLTGAVPTTRTNVALTNLGTTYTHPGFPVATTLGDLALQNGVSDWASGTDVDQADILSIASGAGWIAYFHNGTNWQRTPGADSNRDTVAIPAGTPIRITKRSGASGTTPLLLPLPYTL
ncbi:MAG: hypothetical protein SynsKO_28830 [Synoicihabitans sp.]